MGLSNKHRQAIGEVFDKGYEVFGTPEKFNRWLMSPIKALDNNTPISLLESPDGVQSVLTVIGRLERGVYS